MSNVFLVIAMLDEGPAMDETYVVGRSFGKLMIGNGRMSTNMELP